MKIMNKRYFLFYMFLSLSISNVCAQDNLFQKALKEGKTSEGFYIIKSPNLSYAKYSEWENNNTKYIILSSKVEDILRFGSSVPTVTEIKFVPKNEYEEYKDLERINELKSFGLDGSYTLLWKNAGCFNPGALFAYRFVSDTRIEFKRQTCLAVDFGFGHVSPVLKPTLGGGSTSTYYGTEGLSYDLAEFYDKISVSPTCFETGRIPIIKTDSREIRYIEVPKSMLETRDSLYQIASTGNILDLLLYENKYKSIDLNTKALQSRKQKMLYTEDFFDEQSEKYKQDLYHKTYIEATTYELKNVFRELYAQYDPQQYISAMLPQEIAKKLASYQNLASNNYNFIENYRTSILDIFETGERVNETLYRNKKSETQMAINSCTKDINDYPKYTEEFSKELNQLEKCLIRIDIKYAEAQSHMQRREESRRRLQAERCANCELDKEKSKFPEPKEPTFWNAYTSQNPGKLVMKNGEKQEFYWDKDKKKWYTESGFIFTSKEEYDDLDVLYSDFYRKCIDIHCK